MLELEDKQTGKEYLETLVRYLLSARADLTKEDFNELVKKIEKGCHWKPGWMMHESR